ncbi:MAG TPA: YceI family protein [Gammaproteobacteria bacterium]
MSCAFRVLLLTGALFSQASVQAQTVSRWMLGPGSLLEFDATQQGAKFTGRFERFEATIRLDPGAPETGELRVTVFTASVNTDYGERDEALRHPDLLATDIWATASFESEAIRRVTEDRFEATGPLTIRDITRSVSLPFRFLRQGGDAELTGAVTLSRLAFGVGQGEWANTDWVGDEVDVRFSLRLREAVGEPRAVSPPPTGDR